MFFLTGNWLCGRKQLRPAASSTVHMYTSPAGKAYVECVQDVCQRNELYHQHFHPDEASIFFVLMSVICFAPKKKKSTYKTRAERLHLDFPLSVFGNNSLLEIT